MLRPWRPAPWNDPASLLRVNLQDEWAPVRFRRFFPQRHESFLWLLWLMVTSPHLAIFSVSQFCEKCEPSIKISSIVIVGHFAMADWRRRRSSFSWIRVSRAQHATSMGPYMGNQKQKTHSPAIFMTCSNLQNSYVCRGQTYNYNFETWMFSYLLEWRWFPFCSPKFKHVLPVDIVRWVNIPWFT